MSRKDLLDPKVREVERYIDIYYKNNGLFKYMYAPALCHMLGYYEDQYLIPYLKKEIDSEASAHLLADNLINILKYPIYWIYTNREKFGEIPHIFDEQAYQYAGDLFDLGEAYHTFVTAFTYASQGWITLTLENDVLIPSRDIWADSKYQAYDAINQFIPKTEQPDLSVIPIEIAKSVNVFNDRFSYNVPNDVYIEMVLLLRNYLSRKHELPDEWKISNYKMEDFRRVTEAIDAIANVHFIARMIAAQRGCANLGYINALYIKNKSSLLYKINLITGISKEIISNILYDLIYGNTELKNYDPALQPLFSLGSKIIIAPSLWRHNAIERNYLILMNKLSISKKRYAPYSTEKEKIMKNRILNKLINLNLRIIDGKITGAKELPDIDLCLIDDINQACLLLELKYPISPAEVSEIVNKSEEISKGILQIKKLLKRITSLDQFLYNKLEISPLYTIMGAVLSANWIGNAKIQDSDIPVINEDHFINKLLSTSSLSEVIMWLKSRSYLPREDIDYKLSEIPVNIGKYTLKWYRMEFLN